MYLLCMSQALLLLEDGLPDPQGTLRNAALQGHADERNFIVLVAVWWVWWAWWSRGRKCRFNNRRICVHQKSQLYAVLIPGSCLYCLRTSSSGSTVNRNWLSKCFLNSAYFAAGSDPTGGTDRCRRSRPSMAQTRPRQRTPAIHIRLHSQPLLLNEAIPGAVRIECMAHITNNQ